MPSAEITILNLAPCVQILYEVYMRDCSHALAGKSCSGWQGNLVVEELRLNHHRQFSYLNMSYLSFCSLLIRKK